MLAASPRFADADTMPGWTVTPVDARICRLADAQGRHVGNLKLIGGRWKLKAVGYADDGGVIPGGGPLTDRHDTVLAGPDAASVAAALDRD